MEEFKQVRNKLIDMLEDLDERLSTINKKVNQLETKQTANCPEQSNDVNPITQNQTNNIQHLISQIDNETYGICLNCGKSINKSPLNNSSESKSCLYCDEKNI